MKTYIFSIDWQELTDEVTVRKCKQFRVGMDSDSDHTNFSSFIGLKLQDLQDRLWSDSACQLKETSQEADFVLSENLYHWLEPKLDDLFLQFLEEYRKEVRAAIANAIG